MFNFPFRLRICFNCVINKYLRGYDRKLDLSGWQSRVAGYNSIVRKVERDWKMVSAPFMVLLYRILELANQEPFLLF